MIKTPEVKLPEHVADILSHFSMWHGNTANSPEEYSFWEISHDENVTHCIKMLRSWGFDVVTADNVRLNS